MLAYGEGVQGAYLSFSTCNIFLHVGLRSRIGAHLLLTRIIVLHMIGL